MMLMLKVLVSSIVLWLESVKRRGSFTEVTPRPNPPLRLVGVIPSGEKLVIQCHRYCYRQDYERWFIPDKHFVQYVVSAAIVPQNGDLGTLPQALEQVVSLPPLLSRYADDLTQRKLAIWAYVSVATQALRQTCS